MPFFFHPDIKTYYFQTSFLQKGVVDIYKYLDANKENLSIREDFVYFPMTYFLLGGINMGVSALAGEGFGSWLSNASVSAVENNHFFRYLFFMKLPYLFFDIAVAILFVKYFADNQKKKKAVLIWLFNPFSIWIIYAYSNFDIVVAFLSLLSLYLFNKSKYFYSALALGIASSIKAYPFLFLPFYLILAPKLKDKVNILLTSVFFFLFSIIPFLSTEFRRSALVSGLTTRIFFPGITIGMGEAIIPATFVLVFIFLVCFQFGKKEQLWKWCFLLLVLMFSFIHFHISWLVWIMPFLVIFWVVGDLKTNLIGFAFMLLCFAIPLLYNDGSMTFGLLSGISNLYRLISLPAVAIQKFYDTQSVINVLHTAAAACAVLISWRLLNTKEA
jgi:hypothetical protein